MLTEITNIYFPTDFSYAAGRALPYAAEIARAKGAVSHWYTPSRSRSTWLQRRRNGKRRSPKKWTASSRS